MSILVRVLPLWILGILTAWACSSVWIINPVWIMLVWLVVVLVCLYIIPRSVAAIPHASLHIFLLLFVTSFQITFVKSGNGNLPTNEPVQVIGEIIRVWNGERSHRIKMRVIGFKEEELTRSCSEVVMLQSGKLLTEVPVPGTFIMCEARLEKVKKRENPTDFPERLYWAGEGVRKKGWINSWKPTDFNGSMGNNNPFISAEKFQQHLCDLLDNCSMGPEQAAIVKAMLLGRKDDLSPEIKTVFRQTGISHLLAVSGLHVGLIYLIFIRLFFFMRWFRRIFLVESLAVAAVWAYAIMTGFGPSVQRAAGMISLFALSRILGRRVDPLQVLIIAFIFQTAFDPFAIFRFGFQLSYLAVAGIFIVYGPWTRLIRSSKGLLKKMWNFAGVSIAAQTLTVPFVLVYFHEFPVYFILGNLILVPIGLLVFYLATIYLAILSAGISISLIGEILDFIIRLMVGLGDGIANFPHAMISFVSFNPLHIFAYYFFIVVLFFVNRLSLYHRILWILIFMLIFSLLGLIINF